MKSRLTQAARFVLKEKWREDIAEKIKQKEIGGIKGCAEKFAKVNKGARYSRAKSEPKAGKQTTSVLVDAAEPAPPIETKLKSEEISEKA